jgi:uncharacterized protein YjiS (DUF1127 family)
MLLALASISRSLGTWREAQLLRDRLGRMTDRQLTDIGLQREDIRAFARLAVRRTDAAKSWRPQPAEIPADPMRLLARAVSLRAA